MEDLFKHIHVTEWVEKLTERFECLRDIAVKNGLSVSEKRVKNKDKGRIGKELQVGDDKVMCRVPGVFAGCMGGPIHCDGKMQQGKL